VETAAVQLRNVLLTVSALAAFACTGCSGSPADVLGPPIELLVGPSAAADYASIQRAVDAAPAGSTIRVEPGIYVEVVNIPRRMTIIGPGAVVEYPATGPPDAAVVEIRDTGGVRIEAISVRSTQDGIDGIRVRDASAVVLQSVVASNNSHDGVDIRRSMGVEILDGTFESNGEDGIQIDESSHNIKIMTCRTASNGLDGVKIRNSSDVFVEDVVAAWNLDDGLLLRNVTGARLLGNTVTDNADWGIVVDSSPDTVLENNVVSGNGSGDTRCMPTPCS
jgi:parallel beta-helix repeat protein